MFCTNALNVSAQVQALRAKGTRKLKRKSLRLEVCKSDSQLIHFVARMALTNIASVSEETKNRIVSEPHALSTIQYLQFSDHELVRRAVTETICNLIPNEIVIDRIFKNEEK